MRILALNSGSSSIKCVLLDSTTETSVFRFRVENIGAEESRLLADGNSQSLGKLTFASAVDIAMREIERRLANGTCDAVVHRIVHGGSTFTRPTLVTDAVLKTIEDLSSLAPLHNPPALAVLRAAQKSLGTVPHIAVFDTAFHSTLPSRAREYALPRAVAEKYGLRRYGFHGINHAHVAQATASFLKTTPQSLRIISCHLGNGASVAAIEHGNSVETSMGMTPLEGLMMGSRAGDVDAGILLHLLQSGDFDGAKLDRMLNKESGLVGFAGTFDFRAIEERAAAGDEGCRQAITLYAHRIRKYVGAYAAVMGGVDAIVFTAGIGEHSAIMRHRVSQRFDYLGAAIDEDRNRDVKLSAEKPVIDISAATSRTKVLVVEADEERQMVREAVKLLSGSPQPSVVRSVSSQPVEVLPSLRIPVAVSARHAHLTVATIENLFGKGYELKKRVDLSQHGQFAAQESIALIGPKGRIDKVRVMGPPRKQDQIEITRTDEFALGIDAPVRLSGDLANTPGITIEGPLGRVTITSGVICALRHIHMSPSDGQRFGVDDHDTVAVKIDSDGRDLTFSDVMVRISPDYSLEMHLDTDEANAAGVVPKQEGEIIEALEPTSLRATVKRE